MKNKTQADKELELLRQAAISMQDMKKRLDAAEGRQHEPVAIIGMGCRFPSGANDPDTYWKYLLEGKDLIRDIPEDRWKMQTLYSPVQGEPGRMYVSQGGLVDDIKHFDAAFFGISPREATSLDPQQRLLLEVTWEALENAACPSNTLNNSATGVFIGVSTYGYAQHSLFSGNEDRMDAYCGTGSSINVAAGRISYTLGLQGPCVAVDTACSSSLVATHLAMSSLRNRECRMAIAGGVNVLVAPEVSIYFSKLKALSPGNRCRTFDAGADGYVRGEGCGVIILKLLNDAIADGDTILAVLKASAVNHDGRSGGLTVPNGPSQVSVIKNALEQARLSADDIDYVEAHGTGTPLGDPIEMHALAEVFANSHNAGRPLWIGSVKTNIGHLEAGAGMASIIKVAQSIKHQTIPAHLHFNQWNPHINLHNAPIAIATRQQSWNSNGRPRTAGISSFGISGTNCHVIMEEYRETQEACDTAARPEERAVQVLTLSAKTASALQALAARYEAVLAEPANRPALGNVAYTANVGRSHFGHRLAILAADSESAAHELQSYLQGRPGTGVISGEAPAGDRPGIVFMFTGQGSQYVQMGRSLYETQSVYRRELDSCNEVFEEQLGRSISSVLYQEPQSDLVDQTAYTQPLLYCLEYALARLWESWGVRADAVLGHSVGEYVAACIAGVYDSADGLRLVCARSRLMGALPPGGAMAAVYADEETVENALGAYTGRLSIAGYNSSSNIVISGEQGALETVCAELSGAGVETRRLKVSHGFHSPLIEPVLDEFEAVAARVEYREPQIRLISSLTAGELQRGELNAGYWRRHAREPVRYAQSVQAAHALGYKIYLEVGPHPVLSALGRQTVEDSRVLWLSSLRRGGDDVRQLMDSLARLYTAGVAIDWNNVHRDYHRQRVPLPTYPFEREYFWLDRTSPYELDRFDDRYNDSVNSGDNNNNNNNNNSKYYDDDSSIAGIAHPLLGKRLDNAGREIIFESHISATSPSFLNDHRIMNTTVFPATGFYEMALAAIGQLNVNPELILTQLTIEQPLILGRQETVRLETVLQAGGGEYSLEIYSKNATAWLCHARGKLIHGAGGGNPQPVLSLQALRRSCRHEKPVQQLYETMSRSGMEYGPLFRGIQQLWTGKKGTALARLELPEKQVLSAPEMRLHPALADACLQTLGSVLPPAADASAYLPVSVQKLELKGHAGNTAWCFVRLKKQKDETAKVIYGDVFLFNEKGEEIARLTKVGLKKTSRTALQRVLTIEEKPFYQLVWRDATINGPRKYSIQDYLIFSDSSAEDKSFGDALSNHLLENGNFVVRVYVGKEYRRERDNSFFIDPGNPAHMKRLFNDVLNTVDIGRIVYLWGGEATEVSFTDSESLQKDETVLCAGLLCLLQELNLSTLTMPQLYIVTRGAQSVLEDDRVSPVQNTLWGMGRVAKRELPQLRTVLIDSGNEPADTLLPVFNTVFNTEIHEDELAIRAANVYAARLVHRDSFLDSEVNVNVPKSRPYQLQISQRGYLDNLQYVPVAGREPGTGEIKIAVKATGLNFRDVLNALDLYPGDAGPLGGECAGIVAAVGENSGFSAGDRVMAIAPGCFGSEVVIRQDLAAPVPDSMDYVAAATMPIAFTTAFYALHELAKIQAGDKVLIHAATGGVGQAALQLARNAGAEIFATAGTEEKRRFLRSQGVTHVMDSRTLEFHEAIKKATQGRGVDVVLNSLSGDFIDASLRSTAANGRFVEIGKIGIWDKFQVNERYPGVRYFTVALDALSASKPDYVSQMLNNVATQLQDGRLQPMARRVYSAGKAVQAFRYMQRAKHIGKVVVSQDCVSQESGKTTIRADASYLISGGTGSLGLMIARHLFEQGARSLILMSRNAPGDDALKSMDALRKMSANISFAHGDVADPGFVAQTVNHIQTTLPPLGGVVHAAGVLDDGIMAFQTVPRFLRVMAPKVIGAWNLHQATATLKLDFFLMFSSITSILGTQGQGSYAAANSFLNALAYYRHQSGLPACSINWGPWSGTGMASHVAEEQWANRGIRMIDESQGMGVMDQLIVENPPQAIVMPVQWDVFAQSILGAGVDTASLMPLLRELLQDRSVASGTKNQSGENSQPTHPQQLAQLSAEFFQELRNAPQKNKKNVILNLVRQQAAHVLGLNNLSVIDPAQPLHEYGLDSLMAVELCKVLGAVLGKTLSATVLFDFPTTNALAEHLMEQVVAEAVTPQPEKPPTLKLETLN